MGQWYFIHGAASSRLTWTRQVRVFPRVKRATLPPMAEVESQKLIEALAAWCLTDMGEPSVVVGHSMGGAVAQTMALLAPAQVQALVLVGTGPRLPVNPALIDELKTNPRDALAKIAQWSLTRGADPALKQKSLEQALAYDPHRALREFEACRTFDFRSKLSSIACPKALIAAQEDRMTRAALVEEFRQVWPDAPFHVVEQAGHMMMLERPEAFNTILRRISADLGLD